MANGNGNGNGDIKAFHKKLFAPWTNIASVFWILAAVVSSGTITQYLGKISGGVVDISSEEQKVVSCVVRVLNDDEEADDATKMFAIKKCIPKKVEEKAEE